MHLQAYLQRINPIHPSGQPPPSALSANIETLRWLHRAHLLAIPYENLDIHLGRPLVLDLEHIYTKIVQQGRGGWCYEMNGLFAWALREIGFTVTLLGSTVGAPAQGTAGDSDHLLLRVDLAEPWLVDVGFGNGIIEPLPLRFGSYRQGRWEFRLGEDDDKWFFHNHPFGGLGYGFTLLPRTYASFAARCHELQTSPESGFVRTTVCHRFTADGFASLRGAVLKQYHRDGATTEELSSQAHYAAVLDRIFGLDEALAAQLWEAVWQRHLQWRTTEAQQQR